MYYLLFIWTGVRFSPSPLKLTKMKKKQTIAPLYVKFERPRTVLEFLTKLYSRRSGIYPAAVSTYNDKKCMYLQCNKNWRSINDIHRLIHTYYPSITMKQLMHYLMILRIPQVTEGKTYFPHFGYCPGMNRLRYMPYVVESSYLVKEGGGYSWITLFKLIGITNRDTFKNYNKKP
jgi:hypothetical protein